MRVTTQMTNQVAEQTKIGVNRNSLLNTSDNTTGNALLDELNKTSEEKVSSVMEGNYRKIANSADALKQAAAYFMETGRSHGFRSSVPRRAGSRRPRRSVPSLKSTTRHSPSSTNPTMS